MRVLNIHGAGDLRLDPAPSPQPGPADIVVAVKACGICGSDLGFVKWGGVRPGQSAMPIGHEFSGRIAAVGSAVKDLHVGGRVVVNPMETPGPLGNGGREGAFADSVLVREARAGVNVFPIPDALPWDVAALTEPLAVSLHGVNRAEAQPGDRVVVFGCGMIGLGTILWLADRGITDIVAVDLADERLARATALGATATINPEREDLAGRLGTLHGTGKVYSRTVVGSDIFIDAAGSKALLADIVAMAKRHARLLILAAYHEPVPIDLAQLLSAELTLTAALAYPTEMPDVIAALPGLRDKVAALISHRFALDNALAAFAVAATPASAKVLIGFADA